MIKDNENKMKSIMDSNARLEKTIRQIQEQLLGGPLNHFRGEAHQNSLFELEMTSKSPSDVSSSSITQGPLIMQKLHGIRPEIPIQFTKNNNSKRPSLTSGQTPNGRKRHQKSESIAINYVGSSNKSFFGGLSNSTLARKETQGNSLALKKKMIHPEANSGFVSQVYSGKLIQTPSKYGKSNK